MIRLGLILSAFIGGYALAADEPEYLKKTECQDYLKLGYVVSCTPAPGDPDYATGYITPKGKEHQAAYAEGIANGTIDPNAPIVVTGNRVRPDGETSSLDPNFSSSAGPSSSTGVAMPKMNGRYSSEEPLPTTEPRTIVAPDAGNLDNSSSSAETYRSIISKYDLECRPQLETTQKCCQHPEQCLGGGGNENSAILSSLQAVLASAGTAASLSGACGDMQKVALSTAAINSALAAKCTAQVSQCKRVCSQLVDQAKALYGDCQRSNTSCMSSDRRELALIANSTNSCDANLNYAQQQANQVIASGLTAKTMGLCKEATSSKTNTADNSAAIRALNLNCADASNSSNPACQTRCNRAGSQSDPLCNSNLANSGFGSVSGGLVDPNAKGAASGSSALDEIENAQSALTDSVAPIASKSAAGNGSGGGSLGGGSSDSGSGLNSINAGSASENGSGVVIGSISGGVRTGNGFSAFIPRAVASNDDRSLFSLPFFGKKDDGSGKPFNPKDFLPGGRLDPRRKIAGLASMLGVGTSHGDIFKSITNRYYQVCLRDALMDCESVRKLTSPGK